MSRTNRKTFDPPDNDMPPYVPDPERYVPTPRVMGAAEPPALIVWDLPPEPSFQMTGEFAEVIAAMTEEQQIAALVSSGAMTEDDAIEYVTGS